MSAPVSGLPESGHGWAIYEYTPSSLHRRNNTARKYSSLLGTKQRQEHLNPLVRLHPGIKRQAPLEWTAQYPHPIAALKLPRQLDRTTHLTMSDFVDDVIRHPRRAAPSMINAVTPIVHRARCHCCSKA